MTLKWAKTTKNYAKMGKQNVQKQQEWLKIDTKRAKLGNII